MTEEQITLQALNIHKRFGEYEVLKGIDLTARKGDTISILGSSGSGKSTFLRCLNLLEIPDEGRLFFHDEELKFKTVGRQRLPADEKQLIKFRTNLSMVFQQFNLWTHMTALENVMEAPIQVLNTPKKEAKKKAQYYLNKVGLQGREDFYPIQLSGGQQQRVGIARALAMEPSALLFDEPTSALDPELVNEVLQVIRNLANEGSTMLIVTHEIGFAREVSNKVIFLHEGKIEDHGLPEKIFDNPSSERFSKFLSVVK